MGHFVSSRRERENRDRRDSRGDEREGKGERKMNGSEETEEIKTFLLYPYLLLGPNIQWTGNYGTGIVFIGNMLSWLNFHNFV